MAGGGSGAYRTIQVKFIVDPLLINKSVPPTISVTGSGILLKKKEINAERHKNNGLVTKLFGCVYAIK